MIFKIELILLIFNNYNINKMTELELIKCSYCKKHLRIKILSTQPLKWIPFGNFTSMQYEGLFCSSSCCLQNEKKQNELTS